jgi:hypothetical protein
MHMLGHIIDTYDPCTPDNYRKYYDIKGYKVAVEYYDTYGQEEV